MHLHCNSSKKENKNKAETLFFFYYYFVFILFEYQTQVIFSSFQNRENILTEIFSFLSRVQNHSKSSTYQLSLFSFLQGTKS